MSKGWDLKRYFSCRNFKFDFLKMAKMEIVHGTHSIKPSAVYSQENVTKWIKSCLLQCFGTFKMPILMFISILVFRPEGQVWNPVRRDTRIYVRRILNASRISKTQLNSYTISPSYKENVRFSTVDFHKLKWSRK